LLLGVLLLRGFLVRLVLHGLLVLLVSRVGEALADGLFASVAVCGADDEFVDFERVGVFGGGGADTEIVV
jgi:hypothetical protein